jgi:ketosteroid isomerase-like protein
MASDADLEAMHAWIGAWNRSDLDLVVGMYAADAEVIPDPGGPDKGPYRGHAAIRRFCEGLREEWEKDEVVLTELLDVDDKVLARFDWRTRGRESGIETAVDVTSVSALDDGKITRQRFYFDHAEALKAAGLEE